MSREPIMAMLKRIKTSGDGQEFIDYLRTLSWQNYEAYKHDPAELNEFHKGYALAIDKLLDCFEQCDKEAPNEVISPDWA